MAITTEEVNHIAQLARLNFSEDEKQKIQHELSDILAYVDQLKKIDIGLNQTQALDPDAVNLMRDDVAVQDIAPEEFLKQAPSREGNFIKVKSVLE